jgi:hypothetical protein
MRKTYPVDGPGEEEPDSILGELLFGQIGHELDSRGQEEERRHGDQVEVPGDRVTPKRVVDAGQVGGEERKRNAKLEMIIKMIQVFLLNEIKTYIEWQHVELFRVSQNVKIDYFNQELVGLNPETIF